jgi:hypothetical protein
VRALRAFGTWIAVTAGGPVSCESADTRAQAREKQDMALTAADVLIETIQDWGVDVVFGLPGDGINGIMEALRKRRDQIRFIRFATKRPRR